MDQYGNDIHITLVVYHWSCVASDCIGKNERDNPQFKECSACCQHARQVPWLGASNLQAVWFQKHSKFEFKELYVYAVNNEWKDVQIQLEGLNV